MRLDRDGPNFVFLIAHYHTCVFNGLQWLGWVTPKDFQGQKLCYFLCYLIIISFSLIGAIAGIIADSFFLAFEFVCCGGIVAAIVCVPDWPMYNRKPIQWAKSDKTD